MSNFNVSTLAYAYVACKVKRSNTRFCEHLEPIDIIENRLFSYFLKIRLITIINRFYRLHNALYYAATQIALVHLAVIVQ